MATRLAGAPETVNQLTAELYARIARGEISRVEVMFGRYRQGSAPTIERHLLLPLDVAALALKQPRQAPLHNLAPQPLLERLMAEYVFALLTEAQSNPFRAKMPRVRRHGVGTRQRHEEAFHLRQSAQQARQTEITAELLDLVTGAEALTSGRSRPAGRI